MVFSTNGEQKMDFYVHNTTWTPVDFDGIHLIRRPLPQSDQAGLALKPGFSNAAKWQMAQKRKKAAAGKRNAFVMMDLETTGLRHTVDTIIEFGAIRVQDGQPKAYFSKLVRSEQDLPQSIEALTGITRSLLEEQGVCMADALDAFLAFIGDDPLVGYNLHFDMNFLQAACKREQKPMPTNRCIDLLPIARRKVYPLPNYQLETLINHFSLPSRVSHRALDDCKQLLALYAKLNEI